MRPAWDRDAQTGQSHTPIFDALYSEYRRAFRALPGDRSGEDFTAFGSPYGRSITAHPGGSAWGSSWGSGWGGWDNPHWTAADGQGQQSGQTGTWPSSFTTQTGPGTGPVPQHPAGTVGYQGAHAPAALPPAPRRGV
ncbi:hypothetical protein [Streptomyces sp. NPDC006879]|uniref:hypothetical protein n=1 Tax=Streptomyces sp. NPDC006879 TaxID=3364767 RepID=UPI003681FBFC